MQQLNNTSTEMDKLVFKTMWYVSAWLSISTNLQCLHNLSCSYSMYICVKQFVISLPAMSLGEWFSVKGWDGGGGLV